MLSVVSSVGLDYEQGRNQLIFSEGKQLNMFLKFSGVIARLLPYGCEPGYESTWIQ